MDAVTFLKWRGKITYNCNLDCFRCPFSAKKNGTGKSCNIFMSECPEKAIKIVEKQIERYEISYREDFFEKHPNAEKDENEDPITCRKYIYGGNCPAHEDCYKCWNEIKDDD